jgi:hypothetical protein
MPFFDLRFLLSRKPMKDFAQVAAKFHVQRLAPTLWYENDVIFAVPYGVT